MSKSADMSVALPMSALAVKRKYALREQPRCTETSQADYLTLAHRTSLVSQGCVVLLTRCGMAKRIRESATDTAGLIILIQDGDDL